MDKKLENTSILSELAIPELLESFKNSMIYLSRNEIRFSELNTTNQLARGIVSISKWS